MEKDEDQEQAEKKIEENTWQEQVKEGRKQSRKTRRENTWTEERRAKEMRQLNQRITKCFGAVPICHKLRNHHLIWYGNHTSLK